MTELLKQFFSWLFDSGDPNDDHGYDDYHDYHDCDEED